MTVQVGTRSPVRVVARERRLGTIVRNAGVVITNVGTGGAATVYSDEDLTTTIASLRTDSNGVFEFYAPPGLYSIAFTGSDAFEAVENVHVVGDDTSPSGTYGREIFLSAQAGLDSTGATANDAAFQALVTSLVSGDVLVVDKGTWKFTVGNIGLGGKKVSMVMRGGTLQGTFTSGVPLFALVAGDRLSISGKGRIMGPGKASATSGTNGFTLTSAPGGLFIMGDIEIDGWYHGVRPDGASTGITVLGALLHDCVFTGGVAHGGDSWDASFANNGTSTLHHDIYVIGNDGGASGARTRLRTRSTGCAGASVQLWSDTPQTVSGFDVGIVVEGGSSALAVGDFDTSDCTFNIVARNCTDRAVQVVGNVYNCTFTGVLTNSTGRNIDVTNDSSGRPHANKWDIVSRGGGGTDNTAACFFQGSDDSIYNIVALNPNSADGVRFSGCNDIVFNVVHKGNGASGTAGSGLRFSSSSSGAVGDLYSSGAKFFDLEISAGCNNLAIAGRGASHATLASNVSIGSTCTGIDLRRFTPSLSSGGPGPIDRARVAVLASQSGSVTVDSTKGEVIVVQVSADMTACTVSNLAGLIDSASSVISSSKLTLIIQGNGHAVVWPTAKYAGGAAPSGTGENAVTYWYDGTNLREISRAAAVA